MVKNLHKKKEKLFVFKCPFKDCALFYDSILGLKRHIIIYEHTLFYNDLKCFKCPQLDCDWTISLTRDVDFIKHVERSHAKKNIQTLKDVAQKMVKFFENEIEQVFDSDSSSGLDRKRYKTGPDENKLPATKNLVKPEQDSRVSKNQQPIPDGNLSYDGFMTESFDQKKNDMSVNFLNDPEFGQYNGLCCEKQPVGGVYDYSKQTSSIFEYNNSNITNEQNQNYFNKNSLIPPSGNIYGNYSNISDYDQNVDAKISKTVCHPPTQPVILPKLTDEQLKIKKNIENLFKDKEDVVLLNFSVLVQQNSFLYQILNQTFTNSIIKMNELDKPELFFCGIPACGKHFKSIMAYKYHCNNFVHSFYSLYDAFCRQHNLEMQYEELRDEMHCHLGITDKFVLINIAHHSMFAPDQYFPVIFSTSKDYIVKQKKIAKKEKISTEYHTLFTDDFSITEMSDHFDSIPSKILFRGLKYNPGMPIGAQGNICQDTTVNQNNIRQNLQMSKNTQEESPENVKLAQLPTCQTNNIWQTKMSCAPLPGLKKACVYQTGANFHFFNFKQEMTASNRFKNVFAICTRDFTQREKKIFDFYPEKANVIFFDKKTEISKFTFNFGYIRKITILNMKNRFTFLCLFNDGQVRLFKNGNLVRSFLQEKITDFTILNDYETEEIILCDSFQLFKYRSDSLVCTSTVFRFPILQIATRDSLQNIESFLSDSQESVPEKNHKNNKIADKQQNSKKIVKNKTEESDNIEIYLLDANGKIFACDSSFRNEQEYHTNVGTTSFHYLRDLDALLLCDSFLGVTKLMFLSDKSGRVVILQSNFTSCVENHNRSVLIGTYDGKINTNILSSKKKVTTNRIFKLMRKKEYFLLCCEEREFDQDGQNEEIDNNLTVPISFVYHINNHFAIGIRNGLVIFIEI
ncbi:putative Zinc finger, C2H2-like protein [Pseudoloma neurophilia]|uniref:Putative Zinc finger, C2H2-like protein n=1 Tax=Pseudoloma neurophilia TaxID=146866 RepID=A0A0R0LZE6_9MICR|nr:putative Zinc finger, C2H2-like protein [Pseudoloma neurophilia]